MLALLALLSSFAFGSEDQKLGFSIAPLAGYNSVYGFFFGSGAFATSSRIRAGILAVITFDKVFQLKPEFRHTLSDKVFYQIDSEYASGFDPYYGEGPSTRAKDEINIFAVKITSRLIVNYNITRRLSLAPFTEFRRRTETGVAPSRPTQFPDETTPAIGLTQRLDRRDNEFLPSSGWYEQLTFRLLPPSPFTAQIEGEFRYFLEPLPKLLPRVVLAERVFFGHSLGHPTYLYRYRFGGTDELRGYFDNRFRGRHAILLQSEIRFPIYKQFSGASFVDFGHAGDEGYGPFRASYGFGFRMGLPPNAVQQARLDVGFGFDQRGIFLDFGHTF